MWLAIAINYIDRTVLSAAAPHLIDELKLDPEMMGFIMAAFFWSYSLLQIPAGWFADRFGQKKGLGLAVAWWSIATSMMGVATGFKSLLALRLALGVGEAAAYPSNAGIAVWAFYGLSPGILSMLKTRKNTNASVLQKCVLFAMAKNNITATKLYCP